MSWTTLRDGIDTYMAALVSSYGSSIFRSIIKGGLFEAIAKGCVDEFTGGAPNVQDETFAFSPVAITAHQQVLTETNYGDGWYSWRPLTNHTVCEIDASGDFHLRFQAGTEDTFGANFNGPGVTMTLNAYRWPLSRAHTVTLYGTARFTNPTDFNAGGEWCRPYFLIAGLHPSSATRSWIGVYLSANTGGYTVSGFSSMSGTNALWGSNVIADMTYFTTGTEFKVVFQHDMTCTYYYRKVGDAVWIAGGATRLAYGMIPAAFHAGVGHGICNVATDAYVGALQWVVA